MSTSTPPDPERRVLLLAPVGRDAALAQQVLQRAGVASIDCPDPASLREALAVGAAALLVTEEALAPQVRAELAAMLVKQPPWSDLPVLVLTARGADSPVAAAALQQLGNVILLERPVRVAALVSALRVALRARERQYQIRRHLEDQHASERALRDADRRKDEFLATLAHELRNPLAPVRNGLHILRGSIEPAPVPQRVLGIMERQVEHMVRLVDDLMEVSRITRGKIELRREALDLAAVLRGVIDAAQPQLEAGGQRLEFTGGELALEVWTDPVRMAQVFGNLLSNAIKFTPQGGRIELSLQREDGQAVVQVRDSGVGIAPDMLPRVFDMFAQARPGHRQAQGGLGIGLTLVRTLVEMHGGNVVASSEGEGRGSTFTVRLPLSQGLGARASTLAPAKPLARPVRVLVVDDNRDAADSLATVLESLGATVTVRYAGEEALACLDDARPQLILLDIGMPGMDGHELGRRVRALPEFATVPLVALSGWSQPDDRMRSQVAGFDAHLVKPTSLDALQALLGKAASLH